MRLTNKSDIVFAIAEHSTDRQVYKEMTEPILYDSGDIWFIEEYGFSCVNKMKLKYLYIKPSFRGQKLGKYLLDLSEKEVLSIYKKITAVCPDSAFRFYANNGWTAHKSFINYHKIEKHGRTIF